ncbi:hypothetical protein CHUAL_005459 [Chamberlinius hualienensis]
MKGVYVISLLLLAGVGVKCNDPAGTCVPSHCSLPNCYCSTTSLPTGISDISEMPQIVMLGFDDDIEETLYNNFYEPLFKYTNPNGCNIGITFFLSHDYTQYDLIHDLWQRGHEIASHSITHRTPTDYWKALDYNGWLDEMYGLKQIASNLANIPMKDIVGSRAPFLQGGGDTMFQALWDYGFLYETSMPTLRYTDPPLYPYSLDYKTIQECEVTPCPQNSYPGFWEVPLVDFNSTNGYPCSMLDACTDVSGIDTTYNFLLYNFNFHYLTNKAPAGFFTHASWFLTDPTHYPGYLKFISYLQTLPDVYIVTTKNAIEWMKNPTKLNDLSNFGPWKCDALPSSPCTPQECVYSSTTPGGERYLRTCVSCPTNYPWIGDPYGNKTA